MIITLIVIAFSVSVDTFAASIGKGMATPRVQTSDTLVIALWFGGFQALFPLLGAWIGTELGLYVSAVDHWIIFVLLVALGGNMIREAMHDNETHSHQTAQFDWRHMLPLSVACSIDAFAVGISLALMKISIWFAVALIGAVTAVVSATGLHLGKALGTRWQRPARITGGFVLILIGTKILLEHLGLIP